MMENQRMVTGTTESLHRDPQVGDRERRLGMAPDLVSQSSPLWQTFNKTKSFQIV